MTNKKNALSITVLSTLLVAVIVFILIMASVPPVSRDALTHHLAVPKLWIEHGGIYEIPSLEFSYYPMNLDLLYSIPLYFGNDIIPKYIHFAFALATAGLIFSYLSARFSRMYALTGVLFFLTTPVIVKLSINVYVDLGLVFFTTLSLLLIIKWTENGYALKYLVLSAISCGLAVGIKYNGLISLFIFALLPSYLYVKWGSKDVDQGQNRYTKGMRGQFKALGFGLFFVVVAGLVYAPWMARNYKWTGNPMYPLFQKHQAATLPAGGTDTTTVNGSVENFADVASRPGEEPVKINSHFVVRKLVYQESWWETAAIPIRVFFQGRDDDPKYFDGRLNPFLLLLPLFVLCFSKGYSIRLKREMMLLGGFALLFLLFVFFRIDMRIRWIAPIVPALVMLAIAGLAYMGQVCRALRSRLATVLCRGGIWIVVAAMFGMNLIYMAGLYKKVDPISYLSGRTSRDSYIQRFRPEYAVIGFANQHTPADAVILCLFLGHRGYYSDREMTFNYDYFKTAVKDAESPDGLWTVLRKAGITHMIVRHDLSNQWVHDNFSLAEKDRIASFFNQHTDRLHTMGGHSLLAIQ